MYPGIGSASMAHTHREELGQELFDLVNELIDQRVFGKPPPPHERERDDWGRRLGRPKGTVEVDDIRQRFLDLGRRIEAGGDGPSVSR